MAGYKNLKVSRSRIAFPALATSFGSLVLVQLLLVQPVLAQSLSAPPATHTETAPPPGKIEILPLPPPPGAAVPSPPNAAQANPAPAGPPALATTPSTTPAPNLTPITPGLAPPGQAVPPAQPNPTPEANPVPPPPAFAQPGGQLAPNLPQRDLGSEPDLAELLIEPRAVLILTGDATNEEGFSVLLSALARLGEEARKAGVLITGRPFAVIDLSDDKRFKFEAMLPIENTATTPPIPGLRFGQSPSGQAIRFKYSGAYEDNTYVYESIEAYIEERNIRARPYSIEEFLNDPKDAGDAGLQMFIYYLRE